VTLNLAETLVVKNQTSVPHQVNFLFYFLFKNMIHLKTTFLLIYSISMWQAY